MYMGTVSELLVGAAVYYMGCETIGVTLILIAGVTAMAQMIREEIDSEKRRNKNV